MATDTPSSPQVQKLLTMYTPTDDCPVPVEVIRYVIQHHEKGGVARPSDPTHLMADIAYKFPVTFPFSTTDVNFATITIPKKAGFLVKI